MFLVFVAGIMFSFMKKDKTEKKEKKERKEGKLKSIKESGAGSSSSSSSSSSSNRKLTADELLRLDEVRRSLKIRTRRKEKEKLPSGITADYTANFNLATDDQQQQQQQPASSNSETSLNSLSKDVSAASATSAASALDVFLNEIDLAVESIDLVVTETLLHHIVELGRPLHILDLQQALAPEAEAAPEAEVYRKLMSNHSLPLVFARTKNLRLFLVSEQNVA